MGHTDEELKAMATENVVRPKKRKKKVQEDLPPPPTEAGRKVLKTITEQLPVPLTKKEQREMGQRLAQQEGELTNHESQASQVKANLKARETEIKAEISAMAMALRNGTKIQDVQVQLEADYDQGVVRYVRTDSKEEIRTRPLAEEERQPSLFEGEKEPESDHDPREPDISLPSGVTPANEEPQP